MTNLKMFVSGFLEEGREKLDQIESALIALEREPSRSELLFNALRGLHSLKGASSMLGLKRMATLVHAGESLLIRYKDQNEPLTGVATEALFEMVDTGRDILRDVEVSDSEDNKDTSGLIYRMNAIKPKESGRLALKR